MRRPRLPRISTLSGRFLSPARFLSPPRLLAAAGSLTPGRLLVRLSALVPRTRRGQRRALQGLMIASALALAPMTWMYTAADAHVRTASDVPAQGVAVVFGAGLWDGKPTPYLARRLDTAVELYRAGKVRAVLVTGDNSRAEYDEPDAMRTYLTQHGVPDGRIVSDYAGFDSWDSCVRAKEVFGVDRAVLVSQGFHIRRALTLCRSAGIDAYGVGVDDVHDVTWYYGGAREIFAATKAALDTVLRPDPHFLGPKERGIEAALAEGGQGSGGGSVRRLAEPE